MAFRQQVYPVPTMATGASITSSFELPGSYLYMYLEVPTMTAYSASTPIYIQGSSDGTTFRRYGNPDLSTGVAGVGDFQVSSALSNRMVWMPNFGLRYLQVEVSATVSGSVVPAAFKIVCVSNQ